MASAVAPKLIRLVKGIFNATILRYEGKYSTQQLIHDVAAELRKENLNHEEFIQDIAKNFTIAEQARRAKLDLFTADDRQVIQPAMFSHTRFAQAVIRLGNGFSIPAQHATSHDLLTRIRHQQRAAESSQRQAAKTAAYLSETEPGKHQMADPTLKLCEAMYQLQLWSPNDLVEIEMDEDEDDGE